jgi:hypothetical protein
MSRWKQDPVKPHGTLHVPPGHYVTLDVPKTTPRYNDLVIVEMYLNVTYRLLDPNRAAKVRVKYVREAWHHEGEDATSYQGYWLMPGFDNFLLTRVAYEMAEAGRPCHWEVRVDGADVTLGTRYAKAVQP